MVQTQYFIKAMVAVAGVHSEVVKPLSTVQNG